MAKKRLLMRKLREILRLKYEAKLSHRVIGRACGIGAGTVSMYVQRAKRQGLSWPLPDALDDETLESKLFREPFHERVVRAAPDCEAIHRELKRPGVTLQLLWLEYLGARPQGYRYSQFCNVYRRWVKKLHPSLRQRHRAGEKVFIDYSGKRLHVIDPETGELIPVELFVGVLGASGYLFAEATAGQTLPEWIGSHIRMLEFYGGCPAVFVPDNLRSGVTHPCRYEPEVNRSYAELARFYSAVVIPARVRKPKDKAKAEAGVLLAQRWVLAALRNRTFFSLPELNAAIGEKLGVINHRVMKKMGMSRRQLFEHIDRPALKPLPSERFEMADWKYCRVHVDYHVEVDHNYYSVPYTLLYEQLEARFTTFLVELYYKGRRITSHKRLTGRGQVSTHPEHMPPNHREYREWSPQRLIHWASKSGPATAQMVSEILRRRHHPEQGYRASLGLMRLGQQYGMERLEAACTRAHRLGAYGYRTVKNILSTGLDRLPAEQEANKPLPPMPHHDNIRGAAYYTLEETPC